MSNLIFLDSVWKCLLTLTVSSSVVLIFSLVGQALIKNFTSSEKSKRLLNYHALLTACTVVCGSIILNYVDPELIAGCFNHFATNSNSYTITRLLAGGYLIAFAIILGLDCIRLSIAAKKHQSFKKIENHLINDVLTNLRERLEIKNSIEVVLNKKAGSPYVWGLFNYRIVVNPLFLSSEDRNHITTILSHELMHIKGRDSAWLLLSHFMKRTFFFNPISYIFYAKHKVIAEMAADERAIEQCGVEPKNLLKSILEIAESCTNPQDNLLQMNASQEFAEIKERIQSMMSEPKKKVAWVYPIFSMVSITLSLLITAVQTNASVGTMKSSPDSGEFMCSQVRHEKVIENWLRIESPPNKCEMN